MLDDISETAPSLSTNASENSYSRGSEATCLENNVDVSPRDFASTPLSDEELNEITQRQSPVVIRQCVGHWPLVKHAKTSHSALFKYLMTFDAQKVFQAIIAAPEIQGKLFYSQNAHDIDLESMNFERMNGRLKDGLNILEHYQYKQDAPTFYLGAKEISEFFPGLEKENKLTFLKESTQPNIWIGNRLTIRTHNDYYENMACVAAGRRRFTLFPREQAPNLYIGPDKPTPSGRPVSLVDVNQPDYAQFPKFKEAEKHALSVTLEAGDALYIPYGWWHNVESLDPVNILVNYWWREAF